MKLQTASALSLIAATLTLATAPAQAFSGFSFTTDYSPKAFDPKKDIKLESVTYGGKTYSDFGLVTKAVIQTNNRTTTSQQGPGSSDQGDETVLDAYLPEGPKAENPTNADIVASLGNLNLNSIIDTEDNLGISVIDVYFKKPAKTFYFFERGMNSDLSVDALDAAGNVVDTFKITRALFGSSPAGYSINTTEIDGAQQVGSYGLTLKRNDVVGLRLSSDNTMNGPDYKVFAKVPEPGTIAALGTIAGLAVLARRKKSQSAAQ
jgi:PEP-CTERM motif